MHKLSQRKATSLIELAIVILIIGLLVVVISGANSLITESKIRKTISEINTIITAHKAFETSYDALPGDIINAYDYFGNDCASTSSICNGNGDNKIAGEQRNSVVAGPNDDLEYVRYFQHLKLANLLEGTYSGTGLQATDKTLACTMIPLKKKML